MDIWNLMRNICSAPSRTFASSSSVPRLFNASLAVRFIAYSKPCRVTSLVGYGNFAAASRIAALATSSATPSISNRILPGRTTHTHSSGAPLPLPIRVSAGFLVIGLSGNNRIQTLPPRLIERVMATRAASICRLVIHATSSALSPNSPKAMDDPRQALPARRPRCCFLYLTFFGIIIVVCPQSLLVLARGLGRRRVLGRLFARRFGTRFLLPARLLLLRRHQGRQNRRRRALCRTRHIAGSFLSGRT